MKGFRSKDGSGSKSSRQRDEEARLIQRAQQGDQAAISALYQANVDVVYRYIWARVRDENIAEDLTQQVFLKSLEGLPSYTHTGKPYLAWLYRISYARIVDYWRQQERRMEVPLDEALPAMEPRPGELLEVEADWETAMDLVAQLTDDQQEVLMLRFIGEMSLSQVAETVGKTIGATKAIQHRALASLARMLQDQASPS